MEFRSRGVFESAIWVTLRALLLVGIAGIAWNMFKPGGWLFQLIALIMDNQPTSLYFLAAAVAAVAAAKSWLDAWHPHACANLLTFVCAFAGSYFILRQLLPL